MKRLLLFSSAFPLLLLLFFCGNAGSSADNPVTNEPFNDSTIRPTGMIA